MKFCAFREYDAIATGVVLGERVVGLDDLNDALGTDFGPDLDAFLRRGQQDHFAKSLVSGRVPRSGWRTGNLRYAPPLARPNKIWGIGLNFREHASDLAAELGDEPAAWMRPSTTLAGDGATIRLPAGIGTVTAEAEIGVVIGRYAKDIETRQQAKEAVFGFTPVLDLTAEALLRANVRNLTRAKSYDGFCVVGPFVVTTDEWEPQPDTRIATTVDGAAGSRASEGLDAPAGASRVTKEGRVRQMRHDPYELVRFFSHVFPWEPGDLLLTGTPGALPLKPGAILRGAIEGLGALRATVA